VQRIFANVALVTIFAGASGFSANFTQAVEIIVLIAKKEFIVANSTHGNGQIHASIVAAL